MSDFTETAAVEKRLKDAATKLHGLVGDVAYARQIKEFSSDQRKMLLAKYVVPVLKENSMTAADAIARTSPEYKNELAILERQYQHAERTLAEWAAWQSTFEASRSLLSLSKETLRHLDG